jgi:four helix bundle protein
LKVFQIAYETSLEIYRASKNFPNDEKFGITNQLRRSASSICANIAEGYGRQLTSNADFKRFLVIAKASCHETGVWLDYCKDLGFIDDRIHQKWQQDYVVISKMLFSLIKTL